MVRSSLNNSQELRLEYWSALWRNDLRAHLMYPRTLYDRWVLRGLPRCKNLWSFSLFSRYYFPWFYCVDFPVASLYSLFYLNREFHWFLHRGWIVLRNDVIIMSRAWDQGKKSESPTGSELHRAINLLSFFIYHMHDHFEIAGGRMSYMNLVYGPAHHESFVAQWLEHPTRWMEGHSSIAVGGTQIFSLSHAGDVLITSFLIPSPSLKLTTFLVYIWWVLYFR